MGNSHSQQDILQRAVVGKKSGSRKKADTYHKVIIESKSVDGNLNRIVKSRPENEDHGPISNLARTPFNAFPDPDPKQPQAIKMVPAVKEVQSEPFILHHQTNASSNIIEIQDSSSHRILLNYESSDQPLSDSQKVKQTPSTTESILALQDYSPDSVDLDASLNQFSSKKSQSDGMGTPVIRRAGVRNMQKVDVPALIEASRSGDILPSQPRTNYNSRDKIVNDSMEVFDTNRSADGSQNSVAVMSSMSLSLMHRWSACDPHVISMEMPENIEIRSLPVQQSTTELLKVSDIYIPLQREGLLTKRRALKQALVKFNSCSTLYVQGLLTNLDLRDILLSVASFLEEKILEGCESPSIKSEEIFSERLHPISRQFYFYKSVPETETIYRYIECLFLSAELNVECAIISLVYIQRLLLNTGITLHPSNWARIVLGAVTLASKVWDDHAVWNVDFCQIFPDLKVRDMNELEHRYLYGMHYNVNVKLSTFTKHYFALKEYAEECRMADIRPLNKDAFIKLKDKKPLVLSDSVEEQLASSKDCDFPNNQPTDGLLADRFLREIDSKAPRALIRSASDYICTPSNIPAHIL